jgi:hypothetical protein
MGEKAEELVRGGNQYIAIDLTPLDYIYSDAINRFVNLNRTILDIHGRIVIVASHPKVLELLDKAGVPNFIKIVNGDNDLLKISEMMTPQQPAPPTPAPAPVEPPAPLVDNDFSNLQASLNEEPAQQIPVPAQVAPAPVQQTPVVEQQLDTAFPQGGVTGEFDSVSDSSTDDDEDYDFGEKKSPLGAIIAAILVLAIIGGAAFFLLAPKSGSDTIPEDKSIPAETIAEDTTAPAKPVVEEAPKKAITKTAPKKRYKKKSYSKKKKASKPEKVIGDQINIFSNPAGANIVANGDVIGTTPYTWNNPSAYGDVRLVISKKGYDDNNYALEYLGGKESVSVTLKYNGSSATSTPTATELPAPTTAKELPLPDNSAADQAKLAEEKRKAEATQQAASLAKAEEARKSMEAAKANQAAVDQAKRKQEAADSAKKAELARQQQAAKKAAADKKAASNSAVAKTAASIYFNSLPPMADIYEGTKLIGKTNMKPIETTTGSHTYTFKKGAKTSSTTVNLRAGKNNAPMIRLQ